MHIKNNSALKSVTNKDGSGGEDLKLLEILNKLKKQKMFRNLMWPLVLNQFMRMILSLKLKKDLPERASKTCKLEGTVSNSLTTKNIRLLVTILK